MFYKLKFIIPVLLVLLTMPTFAQINQTLLVIDKNDDSFIPKKFRTSSDKVSDKKINTLGFAELHVAGSAQFQAQSLSAILRHLQVNHMIVVDLRKESHGFINGNAISWYGLHNATNEGKSATEIERIEKALLVDLKKHSKMTVYKIIDKNDGVIERAEPLVLPIHEVSDEAKIVEQQQLQYERFYVQDFHAPDDVEVKRFIQFVKTLPQDEWVYFHCRGGSGRSTTFMVMFDMLRNAKQVSFEDILARHAAIGGKDLTKMPSESSYKYPFAVARLAFLKQFYEQARQD